MAFVVEIISLVILLDLARRIHGARDSFFHPQGYHAWMVFIWCAVATLLMEALRASHIFNGYTEALAVGARLASVTSLWVALVVSMPGALGRRVLEKTRWSVKGPDSIVKLKPFDAPAHEQSSP